MFFLVTGFQHVIGPLCRIWWHPAVRSPIATNWIPLASPSTSERVGEYGGHEENKRRFLEPVFGLYVQGYCRNIKHQAPLFIWRAHSMVKTKTLLIFRWLRTKKYLLYISNITLLYSISPNTPPLNLLRSPMIFFTFVDSAPHIPDSPTSSVWSVRSITALATPMAFLILLRSATAPTSIVSLVTKNTQKEDITTGFLPV